MTEISDDFMRQMLSRARDYCLVILKAGPNRNRAGAEQIIREHGRRNSALRAEGLLAIVCPVVDGSDVSGIGIFDAIPEEAKRIMDQDPAVKEGIFVYEIHACQSFPGDCLPEYGPDMGGLFRDKETPDRAGRKINPLIESPDRGQEDGMESSEYFGALKDDPLLDRLEEISKRMRETAKPRADGREYQIAD